jgi:hypothetical protein
MLDPTTGKKSFRLADGKISVQAINGVASPVMDTVSDGFVKEATDIEMTVNESSGGISLDSDCVG